jgi:hypothetical protein
MNLVQFFKIASGIEDFPKKYWIYHKEIDRMDIIDLSNPNLDLTDYSIGNVDGIIYEISGKYFYGYNPGGTYDPSDNWGKAVSKMLTKLGVENGD